MPCSTLYVATKFCNVTRFLENESNLGLNFSLFNTCVRDNEYKQHSNF